MEIKIPTERSAQLTFTSTAQKLKFQHRFARMRMALTLALVDAVGLLISCGTALFIWSFVRDDLILSFYVDYIPLVLVFLVVYFITGLYTAVGVNPIEELRAQTIVTSVTFLGLMALSFWFRNAESFSRASFILGWLFALILLPAGREVVRAVLARHGLWGEPIAIIGFGEQGSEILDFLQKNPHLGFNPVVLINGFKHHNHAEKPTDIPVVKAQVLASQDFSKYLKGIQTAILVEPDIPEEFMRSVVEQYGFQFSNLILISNTQRFGSLWVTPFDIGGILGLKVRQNLMSRWQKMLKRLLDISIILIASPLLFPLIGFISLLIWIDSRGSIFYGHNRIGQYEKKIKVWKFRTMVENADEVLEFHLNQNPDLKKEWESYQKIKSDPRVTRVGRFLRKFSLDELPQVINVIKGEMSLVGPRPIIQQEVHHYGSRYNIYLQVKPGITGLWQISGRNNLDYDTRVRLDEYYVRNWSFWFDIYILAHTLGATISGSGAY